jgi:NTP pyrophosphatase (non-canonical NTP hydrolase)
MKNQITPAQLQTWAKDIHANAIAKGFYPENPKDRNDKEMLMLIICELAEAVEAHRENRWMDSGRPGIVPEDLANDPDNFGANFIALVKDTVEDEMADALIRILDYAQHKGLVFTEAYSFDPIPVINESFAANCFVALGEITDNPNMVKHSIGYMIRRIIGICDEYNIDICFHVEAKMKYNLLRPVKHGKAY